MVHLRNFLQNAIARPELPLSQLAILDDNERRFVLSRWREVQQPAGFIHRLFEAHAPRLSRALSP